MQTIVKKTKGVETLLGDPKKAIIKLAMPAVISSLVGAIYQITDIIWVSGLGADALAVMGFVGPFFLSIMALGSCWAAGGGLNISKKIGADDKQGADEIASHAFALAAVSGLILFFLFVITARPLLLLMGAEKVIEPCVTMVYIMAAIAFFQMCSRVAGAILYNEGDAKRTMIIVMTGVLLNIVLDPIFIYPLKMGVVGSAVASAVAMGVSFLLVISWFVIRQTTYISVSFRRFRFKKKRISAIFKIGLPITLAQFVAPLLVFFIIMIISKVDGPDGVAIFSTGMRFKDFILLPTLGVSHAVATVVSAAYGAREYGKMEVAFYHALKIGLILTGMLTAITFVLAPQIALIFTWAKGADRLFDGLVLFIRMFSFLYMPITLWTTSVCFFIGIGRSIYDFVFNFLTKVLFIIPLAYLFGSYLGYGLPGIWTALILGTWVQGLLSLVLARVYLKGYREKLPTRAPSPS